MNDPVLHLDGSMGEGGGQILRSSLALSMITSRPFRIDNIRVKRDKPGLQRQHLTAVTSAAKVCDAVLEGAALHSQSLLFTPGPVKPGEYLFDTGGAGSTTLVLQTVLPALMLASAPSRLTLIGGTHNIYAPPVDFLEKAFLPLVNLMGPRVKLTLERAGFFPAGGGRLHVQITPAPKLAPLHLHERGPIERRLAKAVVAGLPDTIGRRELNEVEKRLQWKESELELRELPREWGPGNLITLEVKSAQLTEVFTGFGARGVSAEAVADDAINQARRYLDAAVPVGPCLADQLLLPLALAGGGSYVTDSPTRHTRTNAEVIQRFLPVKIWIEEIEKERWSVRVEA